MSTQSSGHEAEFVINTGVTAREDVNHRTM